MLSVDICFVSSCVLQISFMTINDSCFQVSLEKEKKKISVSFLFT